jgi:hypothetical protein
MNINEFSSWVLSEFEFDCFENDFFENALYGCKEEFENSTFNDVPFEIHYADVLNQKFLNKYLSQLKFLLRAIPKPNSSMSLTILGIHLNSYSNRIDELQSLIQKLEN